MAGRGVRSKPGDPLTARQAEVLAFIRGFAATHGYPPTIREAADAFGIRSHNAIVGHIEALRRKGRLTRADTGESRGVRPVVPEGCCRVCGQPLPSPTPSPPEDQNGSRS